MAQKNDISFFKLGGLEVVVGHNVVQYFKSHTHNKYCFGYVLNGNLTLTIKEEKYRLSTGDAYFINPSSIHSLEIETASPADYLVVCFEAIEPIKIKDTVFFEYLDGAKLLALKNKLLLDHKNIELECGFIDLISSLNTTSEPDMPTLSEEKWVEQAVVFIKENCHKIETVDDIAKEAACSKYHFIRVFKQMVGLTPYEYLIQQRIVKGKRLIIEGETTSEVALKLGFSDQSHFINQFKKYVGITPLTYKRNYYSEDS